MDRPLIMDIFTYSADNSSGDESSRNLEEKDTTSRGLGCSGFLTNFGDCFTYLERKECNATSRINRDYKRLRSPREDAFHCS